MKKLIMIFAIIGFTSMAQAQALTVADINYFKKLREIRSIEKLIEVKQEEKRIAVSAATTTFNNDLSALNTQLGTAEAELEILP